jgi:hypothetical protein
MQVGSSTDSDEVRPVDPPAPGSEISASRPRPRRHSRHRRAPRLAVREALAVVGTWALGASVFFSAQWSSGFDRVMGNTGDARLAVYLNEEWYLALKGAQPWRDPPFFYPTKGVLGYTDTFFLWQVVYAPLRALGADPFLATQLTIVALSVLCFVCLFALLRIVFSPSLPVALVGALIGTFGSGLAQHVGSLQLFGIWFAPGIALVGLASWRWRDRRRVLSMLLGAAFGLLSALFLFSTYYVAWFCFLSAGLVGLFYVVVSPRSGVAGLVAACRSAWRSFASALAGFAIGLVPFFLVYVPVADQLGVRAYSGAVSNGPSVARFFDVGAGNILWGHWVRHLLWFPSVTSGGPNFAITPLLLLTVVAGGGVAAWSVVTHRALLTTTLRASLAACCAAVVLVLLPIKTSSGSAWSAIWHLPGADAIRAIDRVEVATNMVMALALVGLVSEASRQWNRARVSSSVRIVGVVLLCAIALEQANTMSGSMMRRSAQNAELTSVPQALPSCRSFFVTDSRPNHLRFYEYQTEAMLISQRIGLPTVNGYSGDTPRHWELLFPHLPGYRVFVQQWVRGHGLSGVCELDLGTMSWDSRPEL